MNFIKNGLKSFCLNILQYHSLRMARACNSYESDHLKPCNVCGAGGGLESYICIGAVCGAGDGLESYLCIGAVCGAGGGLESYVCIGAVCGAGDGLESYLCIGAVCGAGGAGTGAWAGAGLGAWAVTKIPACKAGFVETAAPPPALSKRQQQDVQMLHNTQPIRITCHGSRSAIY